MLWSIMKVFLTKEVGTESEVEELLVCSPLFLILPTGERRMTWMPRAVWDARSFLLDHGYSCDLLVASAWKYSRESGWPFDISYPALIYANARHVSEVSC